MFRKNEEHLQIPLFSSINELPEKLQKRLEESWAGTFYNEFFVRIDEEPFAVLYSNEASRPNVPINVLVGLETLKSGFGWSDEEMYDHFCYDVQVRYALGYRDLSAGHFELRTVYNFRQRVTEHMQETGVNLIEKAFEQVTDDQIAAFELKTQNVRMDSTLVASNIREMSRLQLLVEVLQRVHRMLGEAEQRQYAEEFEPYLKGSSGQYIYRIKGQDSQAHLQQIGELMEQLLAELPETYADEPAYQVLERVFAEHFFVSQASELQVKAGQELSASSLQSVDDWEATYRKKRGAGYQGYVVNVTETCDPENPFQLIVKVQTEPNNTDDASMLEEALPELTDRMDVEQMDTDGGYNSPEVDSTMRENKVVQVQSAIRGRKPAAEKLGLDDFEWETNPEGQPQTVTCPQGQQGEVTPTRGKSRYRTAFDTATCEHCPLLVQCPTQTLKRKPENVLRFSQAELDLALRRQRSADARTRTHKLRPAVEATVRAVKHPFGNGKVPVRGQPRVSMVIVGSAAMNNVRQINRYRIEQNKAGKRTDGHSLGPSPSLVGSFWSRLTVYLSSACLFRPIFAWQF
jgi:hypothetical protein